MPITAVSNRRIYSNIGIVVQDYSQGTGAGTKRATANLSPEEVQFIFSRVKTGVENFDFKTDKIFGLPDDKGYAQVTKLVIKRANVGFDGAPRKNPWYIEIENGKGIPQKTQIGGTSCQKNSFVSEVKIFANMNDLDFFKLFCRTDQYIMIWELTMAPGNIRTARKAIEESMQTAVN